MSYVILGEVMWSYVKSLIAICENSPHTHRMLLLQVHENK